MENIDIKRRIQDLISRCEKTGKPVVSTFLTPAEQYDINLAFNDLFYEGGYDDSERNIAVILPEWMSLEDIDITDYLSCIKVQSYFGVPAHRDYLGAVLGLGISRDRIGDIIVCGDYAYIVCLNNVVKTIFDLDKVGRVSVKPVEASFDDIINIERHVKKLTFTVKSFRLDAVVGEMFSISRTKASEMVKNGLVSLNYNICYKCDAPVKVNDIISLHGRGKGKISQIGGKSRRDREFVTADIYI